MRALKCYILLLFILNLLPVSAQPTQGQHQSVGLVLSGGGAKGIAHVGVIKALEDNNIPIDYITGTSMGAIVGGLYACGYTPEEMMELLCSEYFGYMSSGKIDPAYTYYFTSPDPSPQLISFPLGGNNTVKAKQAFNPQSLISPTPMAFGFMEIFGAYTAQCKGNFDNLFVPFRCVSSDMTTRRAHVFSEGYLPDAIRASMSFPLVFQALKIDNNIFYDGGIFDNFPVNVMRTEFDPSIMLGFDVSASSPGPPNSFMDQLEMLVMQPQTYDLPAEEGIKVRINLNDYGLLDWGAAQAIYQRGYDATMHMMDSIKARVTTIIDPDVRHIRRQVFKMETPPLRFANVKVHGGTEAQDQYIQYLFKPATGSDTIGVDRARYAFYRAIASDKLQTLTPTATVDSANSELFDLDLHAIVKPKYEVGAGAFITSSNNSFLYGKGSYSSLRFHAINTALEAWIGQSYMAAAFNGSLYLHTPRPSALRVLAVAKRKKFYQDEALFFRDDEPIFVTNHEYFTKVSMATAAGRRTTFDAGIGLGRIADTFFPSNSTRTYNAGRDKIALNLASAFVGLSSSTLDHPNFPTEGFDRRGNISGVTGTSKYFPAQAESSSANEAWLQITWNERDYFNINKNWSIGVEGQAILSSKKLLQSYYSSICTAPAFHPTPASQTLFDPELRANSFLAASVVPIYKYNSNLSARMSLSAFTPFRKILEGSDGSAYYGNWFNKPRFFGELDVVYALPFASICAYANYSSTRNKFNVGISLGLYIEAPKFL